MAALPEPSDWLELDLLTQGEKDFPDVWADPMPTVVEALRSYRTYDALAEHLPDFV